MRIRKLIFVFLIAFPAAIFSQGENNNWLFGVGAGLTFNNDDTLEVVDDGQVRATEGVSAISGPDGALLFYTDGATVYNRENNVMMNGDNLFGSEAGTQSSVIVPLPQSPDIYYIFTVDATSDFGVRGRGMNYSVVDMSMDGGNGAITEKNTNLLGDCTEKIAAVISDCEAETIWILTLSTPTGVSNPIVPPFPFFDTYHAFKMDAGGVELTSVRSIFPQSTQEDRGYLKFSPDGTKLVNAFERTGIFLADFDTNTGMVTNSAPLNITETNYDWGYGVEFSPNSRFLYAHTFKQRVGVIEYDSALIQFDILEPDISASQVLLEERELFRGALQMGTDGRIYRTLTRNFTNDYDGISPIENGTSFLGVINNPNEKGVACNYVHNAIEIPGNRVRQGLPPLVQAFFDETRLARLDDIVVDDALAACVGEPLVLEAQMIPGATYNWEKQGVVLASPLHNRIEIASAGNDDVGIYTVTISRPNAEKCPIIGEISVEIYERPSLGNFSITVCDRGDSDTTDGITITDLDALFAAEDVQYTFYESLIDAETDTPITDPTAFINTVPFEEVIFYRAVNAAGCEDSGELTVIVRDVPPLVIEPMYQVCTDQESTTIEGPDGYDVYEWFNIEGGVEELVSSEQNFDVTLEGTYRLDASIVTVNNGIDIKCTNLAAFEVFPSNVAVIDNIEISRFTDSDTNVEITVDGDGDYEFSSDGITFQDANVLENIGAGTATITVRDKNGCGVVTETIEIIPDTSSGFPNFFTPNNDGINDFWQVLPAPEGETLDIVHVSIYNRFGQFLTQMSPESRGWDGTFNGSNLPASDYWYSATKLNGMVVRGHFTLKR